MSALLPASVVIPTYNRIGSLVKVLESLESQSIPFDQFEVIVVSDGSTDQTVSRLANYIAPYRFNFVQQSNQGPAATRNTGVERASGSRVIFLDDDINAAPSFVASHLAAARDDASRVVIGYLPTRLETQKGYFKTVLREGWEAMFSPMRDYGYRYNYCNFLTGNVSVSKEWFQRLGGFNTSLRCHEDFEFGFRLIKEGANFQFEEKALGIHCEVTDLRRTLRRKREEGVADVQLGRLHEELKWSLPLAVYHRASSRHTRMWRKLAFEYPKIGDSVASLMVRSMSPLELLGRRRWRWCLEMLMRYWYMRGVASELPSYQAVRAFLGSGVDGRTCRTLDLDLDRGIETLEDVLDRERPDGAKVLLNGRLIGEIRSLVGFEPLRGPHLKAALLGPLASATLSVLGSSSEESMAAGSAGHLQRLFSEGLGRDLHLRAASRQ